MKKVLLVIGAVVLALVLVAVYRGFTVFVDQQYQVSTPLQKIQVDETAALQRFSQAIKLPTISYDDRSHFDEAAFIAFHQHLQDSFPLVQQHAERSIIAGFSLVYHLKGQDPSLKPALFMGHMDVVPIEESSRDAWQQAPFSGAIKDGVVWGRGTIDDKVSVMALMEAMELLLQHGAAPQRDIYFAFGHDEEAGGDGAKAIAQYFKEQNLTFEFVLDEGGIVADGLVPGIQQPVALVGIAEKGFVNFRLRVKGEGGHSSQPPNHAAAGVLAQAIVAVENNQMPAKLDFFSQMFERIAYAAPLETRLPLANLWLLSPVVKQAVLAKPSTAASTRTTIAVTMLQGSNKSNVLPDEASALVNFRILPGDTVESIRQHLHKVIDNPAVEISAELANEASAVSSTTSLGFQLIESTIRRLDEGILVAPYLVMAATDSRHFQGLSDNIYRFMLVTLNPQTLKQFHGVNEQIATKDYIRAIQFYYAMLSQAASGQNTIN
ncbi:MAG: M20/M25/M40 family metallo-hydrolase [Paraglaciecola sp.]|nr:M20/M25/M40 family metallo-hydrolase [Paraglaciecola sp.]NCT48720.1 M20/M25/M40 family metallo-hydrolase [Paraglaciecola sp.]